MRLYDEIFKDTEKAAFARCILVPGGGAYFEGVKAVGDFSSERIVVCFPKQTVEAEGENLSIKKYCDGDLHLTGFVFSVKVLSEKGEQPFKKGEK